MKLNLASRTMRYVSLAVVLVAVGTPAPADVITTGDVDPGGASTQPDPWAAGAQLYVGRSGPGTLTVEAGGVVTNARGYLGYDSGATGEATVNGNGSLWDSSERLYVGQSGYGSLGIEAGGRVTTMHGYLGYDSVGTGKATVTGAGSAWDNSGRLRVGISGSGTLDIQAGGLVTNIEGYLGYFPGSTGEVNVNTEGQWDNSDDLFLGGDNLGTGGTGTLNLTNRGLVTVLGTTKLWSTGTLNLDGGNLTTGSFDNSELGTLNFHNGTLTVNGAGGVFNPGSSSYSIDGNAAEDAPHVVIANTATTTLAGDLKIGETRLGFLTVESGGVVTGTWGSIGTSSGSTGTATVTGAGSQWNSSGLTVGNSGAGSLNVEAGGVVTNARGYLGYETDSTGVATITGADSQWNNSGFLYVGHSGTGSLNVESAGVVTNSYSRIGNFYGSTGTATVTGAGSQWNNSGSLAVGYSGNGSLNVESGGVVTNIEGNIGISSRSTGTATVAGAGSQWNNSGSLYVGKMQGDGTLNVESGGVVTNIEGYIGYYGFGATGAATVTGAGSQWNNSSDLYVGNTGSGTLNVEASGVVTNTEGYIGYLPGSTGEVNINTDGRWDNSANLFLGGDNSESGGTGTLNVTNSGLVGVLGTTKLWSTGTLNLDGGNLTTGSLDNSELGTLNFHDGTLTVNGAGGVFNPGSSSYNIDGNAADDVPHLFIANTTTTTLAEHLRVGTIRRGVLTVESAGVVTSTGGGIGFQAGSTGATTITGAGSQWNNSGRLSVGYSGTGTLNVEAGGVVSNTSGDIGWYAGSMGEATVTGAGSQWNNSGWLTVGMQGDGSLNVESAGVVTSTRGGVGTHFGSTGAATVTGAGSQWNNSGSLYIGGGQFSAGGTGTASIHNGGTLTVAGTTEIYAGSTFILEVGTFTTSILDLNGGSFTAPDLSGINEFDFDSGELNVTGPAGLTIGPSAPLDGLALNAGDVLDVAHTLTIASGSTAEVNGAAFNVGGLVVQEAGTLAFSETGLYILGSTTDNTALTLAGTLVAGPANLSLIDADGVDLGSSTTLAGGTLTSSTGFALDGDDDISGYGQLFGHLNLGTNGTVIGSGTGLELFGHVSGTGSISDTTIYGNVDVGNSVGQLTLTDVVLGSDNTVVTLEIGGGDSSLYDTITLAGETTLAGSLEVELIDSFLPQVGDTFSLFSLESSVALQGDFNDILLPDLATGLWDTSGLLTSGNLLVISTIPNSCSWGGDASCNTDDLDALYAVFNTSVPPTDAQFDLNADNVIGEADLTEWLSLAATANGHSSPYLLGDTELDRDVDITDFNNLATHFDPNGATAPHSWTNGNFNGDSNVDITDFNLLSSNFAPDGYGTSAIPEPSALLLTLLSLMLLAGVQVR